MAERAARRDRSKSRHKRNRRRKIVFIWTGAVLVLLVAGAAWVGIRALQAKSELEAAVPLASTLRDAVVAQDSAAISRASSQLHAHASRAESLTSDPVWRIAEFVPGLGPNLGAMRSMTEVVSRLSSDAVGPLTRVATSISLSDFKPSNGSIDLSPIKAIEPAVTQAAAALERSAKRVDEIDVTQTISQIVEAKAKLKQQLDELLPSIGALEHAVRLAPLMLGSDGPRNYLVLFQNPAELRASGGIAGAMALMTTDAGSIALTQQASSSDFPRYVNPVGEIPEDTEGLYGSIVGEYIQDTNLTPNFPLTAGLARQMWADRFGVEVDGVISMDPVSLGYLLDATGPIKLATGDELDSANAVDVLLNDVYKRYPLPAQQDAFFAAAAKAVFEKISSGDLEAEKLIDGLARSVDEHRLLIWNTREEEQNQLEGTALGGVPLPQRSPGVGIYLNDGTGAKMDYYLDVSSSIGTASCRQDGRRYVTATVTLSNSAPADAAELPTYITGGGEYGVTPGTIRTLISSYGASDFVNLGATQDGQIIRTHSATEGGLPVTQVSVDLQPGESSTFSFGFLASADLNRDLSSEDVQITPGINMNETSVVALPCESALW